MNSPSNSQSDSQELLERGRLTLQAIQYHERAARYNAAAASLQAAMVQAENGHAAKLQEWLEMESHQFDADIDFRSHATREVVDKIQRPMRTLRIDTIAQPEAHFETPLHADAERMKRGSETEVEADRISSPNLGPNTVAPSDSVMDESEQASAAVSAQTISPLPTTLPTNESPWAKMEKGAIERLPPKTTDSQEPIESEIVSPKFDADFKDTAELPKDLLVALEDLSIGSGEHRAKDWWKAPHVWVSLIVHVILVICLSILVATVAAEPKLLAIVSASVESDNVLLETPMEMISELESTSEPTQSLPAPSLSDLATDMALATVPIEPGSMPSAPPSLSSALSGASSELTQGSMAGSKMLTGAEFYGVKATGNTFVYIVDSSPSMRRDGAFDAAKAKIMQSLQSMKPKQRYFISFFGKEIDPMVFQTGVVEKYPVYAKPENLTKTIEWLNRVQVQKDGLPPNNALTEAIAMQPDGIFLLFDGDTKSDVAKYLRKANRSDDILSLGTPKVPIHVIHFFQEEFQKQMRQVAEENGGTYVFVPPTKRTSKK